MLEYRLFHFPAEQHVHHQDFIFQVVAPCCSCQPIRAIGFDYDDIRRVRFQPGHPSTTDAHDLGEEVFLAFGATGN